VQLSGAYFGRKSADRRFSFDFLPNIFLPLLVVVFSDWLIG